MFSFFVFRFWFRLSIASFSTLLDFVIDEVGPVLSLASSPRKPIGHSLVPARLSSLSAHAQSQRPSLRCLAAGIDFRTPFCALRAVLHGARSRPFTGEVPVNNILVSGEIENHQMIDSQPVDSKAKSDKSLSSKSARKSLARQNLSSRRCEFSR